MQYDDLSLSYSDEIPQDLYNKLNGRQKSLPKVKNLTFGMNDTWWVSFEDNAAGWSSDIPYNINKRLRRTEYLTLDPMDETNYFLIKDDGDLRWQVSDNFDGDINEDEDDDDSLYMNPQDIRYTQSSISSMFSLFILLDN